jgi:hypothetical protein
MARVLSVAVATFMAGMFMLSSTAPGLASSFGFIFATLIALWETSTPAGPLVKEMLYLIGTISLAVVSVLAVEYIFAGRPPAEELQQQRLMRYQALEAMFTLYAQGADAVQIEPAVIRVSLLPASPQYSESTTSSSSATSTQGCSPSAPEYASPCSRSSRISQPPSGGSTRRSPTLHFASAARTLPSTAATSPPAPSPRAPIGADNRAPHRARPITP